MSEWTPIDEVRVVRAWAIAEATSQKTPLGRDVAEGRCPPELRGKLLHGDHAALGEAEWGWLERAILETRGPLLRGLMALHPHWYEGNAPLELLEQMRFFNLPDWTAKAPSRVLGDLCGDRHVPGREPEFRGFSTGIERLIVVGPTLDGPLCLVEGYTRCCALLRDHRAGFSRVQDVSMLVGITPRIAEWTNGRGHHWW